MQTAVRTLPLYDPSPPDPDGWHAVGSPGGYETWHFDAENDGGELRLVAGFCQGFVFHAGYLRRYYRYLANPAERAPPLPAEYPCAYFTVFEGGRALAGYTTSFRPEQFQAGSKGPDVRVGSNELSRRSDGSLQLRLIGESLDAELTFQPLLPGMCQRDFLSRKMTAADHRWLIVNPLCSVRGEIRLVTPVGQRRVLGFRGRGYHDHNFGSAPLGPGLRRWIRGRLLLDNLALAFQYARPRRGRLGDEVSVVQADAAGIREIPVTITRTDWSGRTALAVRYPTRLHLRTTGPEPAEITLESPRVLEGTHSHLRLTYESRFGPLRGQAFCEVGYPRRLIWPVIGRMIARGLDR